MVSPTCFCARAMDMSSHFVQSHHQRIAAAFQGYLLSVRRRRIEFSMAQPGHCDLLVDPALEASQVSHLADVLGLLDDDVAEHLADIVDWASIGIWTVFEFCTSQSI